MERFERDNITRDRASPAPILSQNPDDLVKQDTEIERHEVRAGNGSAAGAPWVIMRVHGNLPRTCSHPRAVDQCISPLLRLQRLDEMRASVGSHSTRHRCSRASSCDSVGYVRIRIVESMCALPAGHHRLVVGVQVRMAMPIHVVQMVWMVGMRRRRMRGRDVGVRGGVRRRVGVGGGERDGGVRRVHCGAGSSRVCGRARHLGAFLGGWSSASLVMARTGARRSGGSEERV